MRPPWRSAQKRWSEDHLQESSGPQKGEPRKHRGLDLVALGLSCFVSLFLASSFIHWMGLGPCRVWGSRQWTQDQSWAESSGVWKVAVEAGAGMLEAVRLALALTPPLPSGGVCVTSPLCMKNTEG